MYNIKYKLLKLAKRVWGGYDIPDFSQRLISLNKHIDSFDQNIKTNWMAIGCRGQDEGEGGHVYMYYNNQYTQTLNSEINELTNNEWDEFGNSISLSDQFLAVGSPAYDKVDGQVFIYKLYQKEWIQVQVITHTSNSRKSYFGRKVLISEDILYVVGCDDNSINYLCYYRLNTEDNRFEFQGEMGFSEYYELCDISYDPNYHVLAISLLSLKDDCGFINVYTLNQSPSPLNTKINFNFKCRFGNGSYNPPPSYDQLINFGQRIMVLGECLLVSDGYQIGIFLFNKKIYNYQYIEKLSNYHPNKIKGITHVDNMFLVDNYLSIIYANSELSSYILIYQLDPKNKTCREVVDKKELISITQSKPIIGYTHEGLVYRLLHK